MKLKGKEGMVRFYICKVCTLSAHSVCLKEVCWMRN